MTHGLAIAHVPTIAHAHLHYYLDRACECCHQFGCVLNVDSNLLQKCYYEEKSMYPCLLLTAGVTA